MAGENSLNRNAIIIRNGAGAPSDNKLLPNELGYSRDNNRLYVGKEQTNENNETSISSIPINGDVYVGPNAPDDTAYKIWVDTNDTTYALPLTATNTTPVGLVLTSSGVFGKVFPEHQAGRIFLKEVEEE